jgi:hypothetical protein
MGAVMGNISIFRHAELVSASILHPAAGSQEDKWTLKQVQGDEQGCEVRV